MRNYVNPMTKVITLNFNGSILDNAATSVVSKNDYRDAPLF